MAPIQARADSGGGGSGHSVTWGINGLVVVLAVVSVILRFYTRIFTRAGLQADDWLILGALVTALATVMLVLWGNTADPDGLRMSENTDPNYPYTPQDRLYLKLSFSCSVMYFTVCGATKLGILLMYHRIFAISTAFRYQLFISSALVIAWWVGCTIAALRKCQSLEIGLASTLNDPRYCFDFNVFWLASGIAEILLDVLILTLPVAVVVRMRYSLRRKLMVSGIFLLGAFIIVTGIVKVILAYTPGKRSLSYANAELWAALHSSMAIVCASLPIFRPLVRRVGNSSFVIKCSSLLSRRRRRLSSSKSDDKSPESEKEDGSRSLVLSFIASEMVQNLLKKPDAVHVGEQRTSDRQALGKIREEDEREKVPQLPRIDTVGDIELAFDGESASFPRDDENRDFNHNSQRSW
ncbi:hypothetical protein F4820DRAFT_378739 [Hypoxylon rubiginosum]|uniref:Uncharacterized protein n=1 Tax=Hypoxylon rubiginosum TaxID=110542 RepID=A0ACB9YW44_9PEZI|nr:hypothetical protein F4820DRAFT_378739 [Hypoxylon rubiginosum]